MHLYIQTARTTGNDFAIRVGLAEHACSARVRKLLVFYHVTLTSSCDLHRFSPLCYPVAVQRSRSTIKVRIIYIQYYCQSLTGIASEISNHFIYDKTRVVYTLTDAWIAWVKYDEWSLILIGFNLGPAQFTEYSVLVEKAGTMLGRFTNCVSCMCEKGYVFCGFQWILANSV